MNDVDTDKRRRTLAAEEGPQNNPGPPAYKIELTRITRIMPKRMRQDDLVGS